MIADSNVLKIRLTFAVRQYVSFPSSLKMEEKTLIATVGLVGTHPPLPWQRKARHMKEEWALWCLVSPGPLLDCVWAEPAPQGAGWEVPLCRPRAPLAGTFCFQVEEGDQSRCQKPATCEKSGKNSQGKEETISDKREGIGLKRVGTEDADDFLMVSSLQLWEVTVIPLPLGGSSGPGSLVKELLLKM